MWGLFRGPPLTPPPPPPGPLLQANFFVSNALCDKNSFQPRFSYQLIHILNARSLNPYGLNSMGLG